MSDQDFDFEDESMDDLDFDSFDFDGSSPVTDERSVAATITTGALDSALSANTARVAYKALKNNALPQGYTTALDAVEESIDFSSTILNDVQKELKPATDAIQSVIRENHETIDRFAPEWLAGKIKGLGGQEDRQREEVDRDELSLNSSLDAIFNRQAASAESDSKVESAKMEIEEGDRKVASARFSSEIGMLSEIATGIGRQTAYQDTILVDFQRKSLELQHRQFFLARDLVAVQKAMADATERRLEAIQQNTALPDIQKSKLSEEYMATAQASLIGDIQGSFNDYAAKASSRFRENIRDKITSTASSIGTGVASGVEMAKTFADNQAQMSEMGIDSNEMIGGMAGDAVVSKTAELVSNLLGDRLKTRYKEDYRDELYNNIVGKRDVSQKQRDIIRKYISDAEKNNTGINLDELRETEFSTLKEKEDFIRAVGPSNGITGGRQRKVTKTFERLQSTNDTSGDKNTFVQLGEKLQNLFESRDSLLNEWALGDISITKVISDGLGMDPSGFTSRQIKTIESFMRSMMPSFEETYSVGNNLKEDALKPMEMTLRMHHSITDIIPGYLARMLQQLETIATGEQAELTEFSVKRNTFVKQSVQDQDLLNSIISKDTVENRKSGARDITKTMTKELSLSEEDITTLSNRILGLRDGGRSLSVKNLRAKPTHRESEEDKARIDAILNEPALSLDEDTLGTLIRQFNRIDTMTGTVNKGLANASFLGQRDAMFRSGLLQDDGSKIDFNAVRDLSDGTVSSDLGGLGFSQTQQSPSSVASVGNTRPASSGSSPADRQDLVDRLRKDLTQGDKPYKGVHVWVRGGSLDINQKEPIQPSAPKEDLSGGSRFNERTAQLDSIKTIINDGFMGVSALLATLATQNGNTTYQIDGADLFKGMMGSVAGGVSGIFKGTMSTLGSVYSNVGRVAGSTLNTAKNGVTGVWDWATGNTDIKDVYVRGREGVALSAVILRAGGYFDQATGEQIRSLADIGGNVVNKRGEVVLSEEDIKEGLYDKSGSRLSQLGALAKSGLSTVYNAQASIIEAALKVPGKLYDIGKGKLQEARNAYVRGEKEPRLLGLVMRNGGYFSELTEEPIKAFSEIDGPVIDSNGVVRVTMEDLEKGLVDRFGVSIEVGSLTGYLARLGMNAGKKALSFTSNMFRRGKDAVVGTAEWAKDLLNTGWSKLRNKLPDNVEFLLELKDALKEQGLRLRDFDSLEQLKEHFPDLDWEAAKVDTFKKLKSGFDRASSMGLSGLRQVGGMVDNLGTSKLLPVLLEQLAIQRSLFEWFTHSKWDPDGSEALEEQYADVLAPEENVQPTAKDQPEREGIRDLLKKYRKDLSMADKDEGIPTRDEAIKEQVKEESSEEKPEKLGGLFTSLATMIKGGLLEAGKWIAGSIAALLGAGGIKKMLSGGVDGGIDLPDGGTDRKGGSTRSKIPTPKKTGFLGKLLSAGKSVGKVALSGLSGIGGLALRGLGLGATAVGGIVSAPVVIGAAAVAGAAAVGYGAYKFMDKTVSGRKPTPLESLRIMQYGVDVTDIEFLRFIRHLESDFISDVKFNGGQPSYTGDVAELAMDYMPDLGMNVDDPYDFKRFTTWVKKRFGAILLTHMTVAKALGKDIEDIEDLTNPEKIRFVGRCRVTQDDLVDGYNPYGITSSPFKGRPITHRVEEITRYEDKLIASYTQDKEVDASYAGELTKAVEAAAMIDKATTKKTETISRVDKTVEVKPIAPSGMESALSSIRNFNKESSLAAIFGIRKVVNWFTDGDEVSETPIKDHERLRLLQYGVPLDRENFAQKVRRVETLVWNNVTIVGKTPKFNITPDEMFRRCGAGMGLSLDSAEDKMAWLTWYNYRFLPVFIQHVLWLHANSETKNILEVDTSMSRETAIKYLANSFFTQTGMDGNPPPIKIGVSPMRGEQLVGDIAVINGFRASMQIKLGELPSSAPKIAPVATKPNAPSSAVTPVAPRVSAPRTMVERPAVQPVVQPNTVMEKLVKNVVSVPKTSVRYNPVKEDVETTIYQPIPTASTEEEGNIKEVRVVDNVTVESITTNKEGVSSITVATVTGAKKTYSGIENLNSKVTKDTLLRSGTLLGYTTSSAAAITNRLTNATSSETRATRRSTVDESARYVVQSRDEVVTRPIVSRSTPKNVASDQGEVEVISTLMVKHHSEAQDKRSELVSAVKEVTASVADLKASLKEKMKSAKIEKETVVKEVRVEAKETTKPRQTGAVSRPPSSKPVISFDY